ncbi:hypothetical protein XA68_18475 [Ophiocordyceps unilateralis]|uniref:Benzoate 4-monooxygenase cytochrome P450 n=1 Tax=Ophiocordyceps unilateralis TaxID=268505 RepID=A0A2A9P316_OPHUN|nr:hypothetical protein XA68_18475 [Ophiocordyceps unilateralis]
MDGPSWRLRVGAWIAPERAADVPASPPLFLRPLVGQFPPQKKLYYAAHDAEFVIAKPELAPVARRFPFVGANSGRQRAVVKGKESTADKADVVDGMGPVQPVFPPPGPCSGTVLGSSDGHTVVLYGDRIRPEPNTVLFCGPDAHSDIYGTRSNVRRSCFYSAFNKTEREETTFTTVDVARHARKRRILNVCFNDKLVRAATPFVIKHVDRWNHLLMQTEDTEWSPVVDFSQAVDALIFDIMGDLSFGRSFDIKESGDNPIKEVPDCISAALCFYYPICRSPFLKLLLWLKPRGLDRAVELISPPTVHKYDDFVCGSVADRLALQRKQADKPEAERRQDMFYFLCDARDTETGLPAYNEDELRAECSVLITAGSGTTAVSLSGVFFYLTGDRRRYQKLVDEILTTFATADDIVYGPKLLGCRYLRACVDEGMRLTPAGASEHPREVLPGGIQIRGEYYPAGTTVGTVPWADSRNQDVYGDAHLFRPERWIVDEASGVSKEDVLRIKANFHPFLSGPCSCIGKSLALMEMYVTVARTLHRLDVRRRPGSTLGGGAPELGWGERDPTQLQLRDAFVSLRQGPEVQFRKRSFTSTCTQQTGAV